MNVSFSQGGIFCQKESFWDLEHCNDSGREFGTIKLKLHVFQRKNDLKAYLEWGKKVDWIFDYHYYREHKKVKLIVIKFYKLCTNMVGSGCFE
jgi:hypothetical protein